MFRKILTKVLTQPVRWIEVVLAIALFVAVFTAAEAAGPDNCPLGQTVGGRECILVYNPTTGACMTTVGLSKGWEEVDVCPIPVPTTIPTQAPLPVNTPIIPVSVEEEAIIPITGNNCPKITVTGKIDGKEIFTADYSLVLPAGETWSFGDLRVDELVFVSSQEIFLEETDTSATSFTWIPSGFSELRFRETKMEPTCKVRFLFTP